jgi:hypothetical protein
VRWADRPTSLREPTAALAPGSTFGKIARRLRPFVRAGMGMRRGSWSVRTLVVSCALAPAVADARTPLPTLEVVPPEKKRVRLLDVRWAAQIGYGYALARRAPVLALGHEGHVSFVELSSAAQLHVAFGSSGFVDPSRGWHRRTGVLGADLGVGLSRHVTGGPALVATVTAGPRWEASRTRFGADIQPSRGTAPLRVDGWGIAAHIDAYPFYMTIPEILHDDRGWFREYVLSGLHVWVAMRHDVLKSGRGQTVAGGIGLDLGRTLLVPILASKRSRGATRERV